MRSRALVGLILAACAGSSDSETMASADSGGSGGTSGAPAAGPLPAFVDDCDEGLNDDVHAAAGLDLASDTRWEGLSLCAGDLDFYRIDVPPGTQVALQLSIADGGSGASNLDLWEVEHPDHPIADARLDLVPSPAFDPLLGDVNIVWGSSSVQAVETLTWDNGGDSVASHWIAVAGFEGGTSPYDLVATEHELHDVRDCDEVFEDTSEEGPCNQLIPAGQPAHGDEGWLVTAPTQYAWARRELIYLARWAARETAAAFPNTDPIAILDLSEADGETPGADVGDLRHPEGTHIEGNDLDLSYYQTGPDNLGREVCPHDGEYCTGPPDSLDAPRTAFLLTMLATSPELRVIGVDPQIRDAVEDAAWILVDDGMLEAEDVGHMLDNLASGEGWPRHHHHLHFSWNWETGW